MIDFSKRDTIMDFWCGLEELTFVAGSREKLGKRDVQRSAKNKKRDPPSKMARRIIHFGTINKPQVNPVSGSKWKMSEWQSRQHSALRSGWWEVAGKCNNNQRKCKCNGRSKQGFNLHSATWTASAWKLSAIKYLCRCEALCGMSAGRGFPTIFSKTSRGHSSS